MDMNLPGIVVTGASGFIGRHFLEAVKGKYRLFCLARRSQKEVGIPREANLRWTQVDIAKWNNLKGVVKCVLDHGGADYVLKLAGYYDFTNLPNPEYQRTNVLGTENVLKLADHIGVKRFIFASSLAAFNIKKQDLLIDETSPLDADFPYAWSKRVGEENCKKYKDRFSVSILRLAAVYSDWCEYGPLYKFLQIWLSGQWNSRILAGKGESAISYIHIHELVDVVTRVIDRSEQLPRFGVYIASPDTLMSHLDIFKAATRYYFGRDVKPLRMPKMLVVPGIALRQFLSWICGPTPFEKLWMVRYIDKKLSVNSQKTQAELEWKPTPRLNLKRRLLKLVENMKHYESVWQMRNEEVMHRVTERPNLVLYEAMTELRDVFIKEATTFLLLPDNQKRFRDYHEMEPDALKWYLTLLYQVAAAAVRTRDRMFVLHYAQIIAYRRYKSGFHSTQVHDFLTSMAKVISLVLQVNGGLQDMKQQIYDYIDLSFQLAADEVEDIYDMLEKRSPELLEKVTKIDIKNESTDIQLIIRELEDICFDAMESPLVSRHPLS